MRSLTGTTLFNGFKVFVTCLFTLFVLSSVTVAQQEGASSAAAARARYLAETGLVPPSREIAVEEIINYHRHQIGRPRAGEAVAMDVRWGNDRLSTGHEAVLQVGFSTALASDRQQLRPLNLALVIDKSGSMADSDKMSRVKSALQALVTQLRDTDVLSIVVFDSVAEVLMPAHRLGDREEARRLIRQIEPGNSTNIHAGLMLGYHEALKNYAKDKTNRVILLTDGIANTGVTEPQLIARDSVRFNDLGIDLSTIGVGLDLNQDLLRELASSGRGLFHFVADAQDIQKVFVKELQSLISPVATAPNVEIDYGPGLELAQLYGYQPRLRDGSVTLKLDNMNQGLTEVVLLRFRVARWAPADARLPVRVRLSYYDRDGEPVVKTQQVYISVSDDMVRGLLEDSEVAKNYSIAILAQALRDMAVAYEARHFKEAERLLTAAIERTYSRYPHLEDEDIRRNLTVAEQYQESLRKYNRLRDSRDDK